MSERGGQKDSTMPVLKTYSYKKTGELLRDDQPYSIRTIERMVDDGDLERIGKRMRRAISGEVERQRRIG